MTENKTEYTFQLFAPNNNKANLLADFNDWKAIEMKKSDDGYFRLTEKLADGIHQYRFEIQTKSWFYKEDEWKTIADPYATEVDGATQNSILRLKNGEKYIDEYQWQFNDVELPENNKIIIYEMHVGDFSGGEDDSATRGKYKDVIDKLDYLSDLGINTIEMMPIKESPGDFNWGYSPKHFFASEENFGASFELKELIDKSHAAEIRVLMDGVYNHANTEMPLTQIDHDYWFHHDPKDPENNWGPEFNYEYRDEKLDVMPSRKFILDSIKHWLNEYEIDGIRFDGVKQLGNFEALALFDDFIHNEAGFKPFISIAEYIPTNPEVVKPIGPMDSCWNDTFMYVVREHLTGEIFDFQRLKEAIDSKLLGFSNVISVVNYLCNHDHNRLFQHFAENEIFGGEAFVRAKLGATILLTAVGIPMIWMGEEFGEYREKSESSNKINWKLLENTDNKSLFGHYKTLIRLRKMNPALHNEKIEFIHEDAESRVLAFWRYDDFGKGVAVILNLSGIELKNYAVKNFPAAGIWHDWLEDSDFEVSGNELVTTLKPFEGKILVNN